MSGKERGLGRGLNALLSGGIDLDTEVQITELNIDNIIAGEEQPRKSFDQEALQELASSIREHGLLQPILVRARGDKYEIIAGERRWRAARIGGIDKLPAIIREMDDIQAAEVSLIENLQRDDLSAVEEALAYRNMVDNFGYTQELIAEKIGKSRAHVANTLRILNLPEEVLTMIEDRKISAGHARSLLSLGRVSEQLAAAREIIDGGLSVRDTEKRVRNRKKKKQEAKEDTAELIDLRERLEKYFGTRAEVVNRGKGGKIEIFFYNEDDLERIIGVLGLEGR